MISAKKLKMLAQSVVDNVKDVASSDCNGDDVDYAVLSIDKFIAETKGVANSSLSKAKKSLIPLRNTLLGSVDISVDDSVSVSSVIKDLKPKIVGYTNDFINEVKLVIKSPALAASRKTRKLIHDNLPEEVEETTKRIKGEIQFNADADILLKYVKTIAQLPKTIDKEDFSVIKAPVLPIFNKDIKYLNKHYDKPNINIKYDAIDYYYILPNQYLIAFNSNVENDRAYVDECLNTINESGHTKYDLVADRFTHHPRSDVSFAWIMERTKFQRLIQSTGSYSVRAWEFPVNIKASLKKYRS